MLGGRERRQLQRQAERRIRRGNGYRDGVDSLPFCAPYIQRYACASAIADFGCEEVRVWFFLLGSAVPVRNGR